MKIKRGLELTSVIVGALYFLSVSAFAVLPPKVYEERVDKSKIKAIAVVKDIKVVDHYNSVDDKQITFTLIKSFGEIAPPKIFMGRCESVNKRWFEHGPGVGGDIYYYPNKNDEVYVTIAENGSEITSYTKLTDDLKQALSDDFKKVKTKIGTAYVGK
ncbi:MAG: hypothetical protein P9X27_05770 [Candidatus Kaelpia aquatica]|nr:hypothetical protein [Candidatus Kaelpia aquatica]